jgi:hypothetical protein
VTARFASELFPSFQAALLELSNGQLDAEIIETNEATIMPIGTLGPDTAVHKKSDT